MVTFMLLVAAIFAAGFGWLAGAIFGPAVGVIGGLVAFAYFAWKAIEGMAIGTGAGWVLGGGLKRLEGRGPSGTDQAQQNPFPIQGPTSELPPPPPPRP